MTAGLLKDNPSYLVILHGHANPTKQRPANSKKEVDDEEEELIRISLARATDTARVLKDVFVNEHRGDENDIASRIRITGYGGALTMTKGSLGSVSGQPSLNRRVEVIVFTVD